MFKLDDTDEFADIKPVFSYFDLAEAWNMGGLSALNNLSNKVQTPQSLKLEFDKWAKEKWNSRESI